MGKLVSNKTENNNSVLTALAVGSSRAFFALSLGWIRIRDEALSPAPAAQHSNSIGGAK